MNTEKNLTQILKKFSGSEFKFLFLIYYFFPHKEFTVYDLHKISQMSIASAYNCVKFLIKEGFVVQTTFPKTKDEKIQFKTTNACNLKFCMEKDIYG